MNGASAPEVSPSGPQATSGPVAARAALRSIPGVIAASRLEAPPVPTFPFGIAPVDALTGGLPRGCLTEICGPSSSGRTSLMLSAMAETTTRGELCALIDVGDSFDPHSAAAAGVDLERLLWIRCSDPESSTHSRSAESEFAPTQSPRTSTRATASGATFASDSGAAQLPAASSATHVPTNPGAAPFPEGEGANKHLDAFGYVPRAKIWYGRAPARSERSNRRHQLASPQTQEPASSAARDDHKKDMASQREHKRLWTHRVEQALKCADLLLAGGGFGLVILDFGDVPHEIARRVPLASWFRFRRTVENTPAVLLSVSQQSCAKTCASLVLQLSAKQTTADTQSFATGDNHASVTHAGVLTGLATHAEIVRSRTENAPGKKPPRGVRSTFDSRTEWTG